MNILDALKQLRDDIKAWVTANINALNKKIDEKTVPIDNKLDSSSTNPVQNKVITKAINNIPKFSGDYNDLTNAPDISEDSSGNMTIADESGNIIFKADAEGIHTTAVAINGESAATEKYVDEAIANIDIPDVDFTGYATEEHVTTEINSAKEELSESIVSESNEWKVADNDGNVIFSVDAAGAHTTSMTLGGENAATEKFVADSIAAIEFPETDLSNYYTKQETESLIPNTSNFLTEIPAEYVTETELTDKGFLTEHQSLDGLATTQELEEHVQNSDTHVTSADKQKWDAKSNFSGDYNDLTNAPAIVEDEPANLIIADNAGNIIFRASDQGLETTHLSIGSLTINGMTIQEMIKAYVDEALLGSVEEEMLEGDGQEFYTTAPSTLSFRSTAPLNELQEVQINGETVDPSNYDLEEGSTIVKLKHNYLSTLDLGRHNIAVVSNKKTARGDFTVTAPELNEHNFYYNQPYYLTKEIQAEEYVRLMLVFLSAETLSAFNIETGDYRILPYTYNDSKLTFSYKLFMEELLFSLDYDTAVSAFIGNVSSSMVQNTQEVIFEKSAKIVGDAYYIYVKNDDSEEWQCFWNRKVADQYPPIKSNICGEPVTTISVGGFEACDSLTQVSLPDTIHTLWERSFSRCSHLESVVLPAGLIHISDCAFSDCGSLNTIVFKGTIEQWNAVQKFNSWNFGIPATYVQCSDGQVML
jgi:hypothetical protein